MTNHPTPGRDNDEVMELEVWRRKLRQNRGEALHLADAAIALCRRLRDERDGLRADLAGEYLKNEVAALQSSASAPPAPDRKDSGESKKNQQNSGPEGVA